MMAGCSQVGSCTMPAAYLSGQLEGLKEKMKGAAPRSCGISALLPCYPPASAADWQCNNACT